MAVELMLRLKNRAMDNYDIEMWRYARELKQKSADKILGHEHIRPGQAVLQNVTIRINKQGLRGGPIRDPAPKRRILFLGSSVTLGWGVPEKEVLTSRIQKLFEKDGQDVEVLNAGIGNYNTERYVHRYLTRLKDLNPTDIVVHYFVNDVEILKSGGGNILLRNSQTAVMIWSVLSRYMRPTGEANLVKYYRKMYQPDSPGYKKMRSSLVKLADYAKANNQRIYLAMTPDVRNLVNYKLGFIHAIMKKLAKELGFIYIDLLPPMEGKTPKELWAMPGDPHPNSEGHKIMAKSIYAVLSESH